MKCRHIIPTHLQKSILALTDNGIQRAALQYEKISYKSQKNKPGREGRTASREELELSDRLDEGATKTK